MKKFIKRLEGDSKNIDFSSIHDFEEDYSVIQETLYISAVPGLVDKIRNSSKEPVKKCKIYNEDEKW